MSKEIPKAIKEILLNDAEGGPVEIWDYDPNKLKKTAEALVSARKTGVIPASVFSESFTQESGRQDLLPKILVIVPDH